MKQNELLSRFAAEAHGFMYTFHKRADGRGYMSYASPGIRDIFGLEPEDVMQDIASLYARVHPDDLLAGFIHADEISAQSLAPLTDEFRVNHPQKGELWVEVRATPEQGADGSVIWHGLITDIIERKRAEKQLFQYEYEFRSLAESSPDFIMRYDYQGRMRYINSILAGKIAIPAAEIIGKLPREVWTDGRFAEIDQAIARAIETETTASTVLIEPTAEGELNYVQILVVPERDVDGKVIGTIAFGRDISELKRMQEKVAQSEREFRTLAENSPDTIVRYDRECRFVYVNPLFEKAMGFRLDELRGKMPTQVPGLPEAEFFQQRIQEVIETGRMDEFEHAVPMHDGVAMWKLVSIFPELDTEGRLAYVQVLSRDISVLKEAERQLEASRARLRQLLAHQEDTHEQERKKISWDMHEELLQILVALQMYVAMLQSSSDDLPERFAKTLPAISSGANQSIRLVREMVTSLRPTVLNLGILAALEWLVDEFDEQYPDMVCKLEADKEAAQMDEKSSLLVFRIAQESLIFTAKYKTSGKVSITLECDENGYLLVVCDKSKGNNVDLSDTNFFGLYGLQERVLVMGGEMVVFSASDYGLIIEARLPTIPFVARLSNLQPQVVQEDG
jgi:PAS domain S-box-containing protein